MQPRARIGERLVASGHITAEQLNEALAHKRKSGGFLGDVLIELGHARPETVGQILADDLGVPYVRLADVEIEPEAQQVVPEQAQRALGVVAYRIADGAVHVAMADPLNVLAKDDLRLLTGMPVVSALTTRAEIEEAYRRLFTHQSVAEGVIAEIEAVVAEPAEPDLSADQLAGMAGDAPIVRLVNSMIAEGVASEASDIHIEPREDGVRVRYRIDGLLAERMTFPRQHLAAVVSRIKIISHLNIAERRRSQDGRIVVAVDGRDIELRVSTLLLAHGEKVVMRILDKRAIGVPLGSLGFLPEQLPVWSALLERPHGIILVTGPTGSGKSTTLYTSLGVLNDETRNIITIEDPIEYELPGVNQSQVNERIGVTFASGLRTIVRQDPDVIMVGEIRDAETAETAVQAALTGHLVLSTLHTNDAPGALVRLQNLGVEPFLISSSVIGVAGQRLVRKVCTACAAAYEPEPRLLGRLGIDAETARVARFRKGAGCRRCGGRGMKGRTAVYEVMPVSDELRDAIGSRAGSAELAQVAGRDGMTTLCEAGVRKALSGETTVEEVQRLLLASDVRSDGVGKVDPTPPAIRVAA